MLDESVALVSLLSSKNAALATRCLGDCTYARPCTPLSGQAVICIALRMLLLQVAVTGSDVVFKDIVEPLEFVSVTLTKTDKSDITEFGDIQTVRGSCLFPICRSIECD